MAQKRGLYGEWKSGELTREEYASFKEGYDRQENDLRRRLEESRERKDAPDDAIFRVAALPYPETLERGLVNALVKRVEIDEQGEITIEFRFRQITGNG
jgi:hypothetical protein